ncbi:MAG: Lipid A core--O-antigen ligase-like protein [Parcubacteria group bacterium Gr01-1014_70]|nr:MAG: Lipid A core--O-antigen ligase-like protein [Parcubacteria group bacterium Gr01-1014_70]
MRQSGISTILLWGVRVGIWLLLCTPLVVAPTWFFPYITGKNFFFRIVTELAFGMWLALILVDAQYRPRRGFMLYAFLGFIVVMGLATFFGIDPYNSFWSNYERMEGMVTYLHVAALFLMASSVFRTLADWRLTFHVSVAVSLIIAGYGFLELMNIITIPGSTAGASGIGIFSRLGNQIYLAAYLLFHFFILGFLYFSTRVIWWRIAYALLGVFEFYIFIHTGTRGALIGLVVGLAVSIALLFLFSLRDNKRIAVYTGTLMVIGIILLSAFYMLRDSAFIKRYPLVHRFADINLQSSTAQSRIMIWGIAKEAFLARPLLGWGPGNFIIPYAMYYNPNLYGNEPWFDRVHNMHFEWLVAGGIVGFLAYVALIGSCIGMIWRLWRKRVLPGSVVAALGGFLAAYLAQNTFVFDTIITYLFFVLLLSLVHSLSAEYEQAVTKTYGYQRYAAVLAPLCIVLGIVFASTMHTKQMRVAGGIITMLNTVSSGKTVFGPTNELDAIIAQKTFGTSEARERFVDIAFEASRHSEQIPKSDILLLLSRGIEEIQSEVSRNPSNVRSLITLGKLLQLRAAIAQSLSDRDESIAVYEQALAAAPRYPSTYIGLAEAYLVTGETKKASEAVDSIFQQMVFPNTFVYSLLTVSILDNDFDKAAAQVKRFRSLGNTEVYPRDAVFESDKLGGVIPYAMRNPNSAGREQFLDAIFEFQKRPPSIFLAVSRTKAEVGKFDEARKIALQLAERYPDYKEEVDELLRTFP